MCNPEDMAKLQGFTRIVLSGLIAAATLIGIAPNANAVATAISPTSGSTYIGAASFSVSGLPTIASGSFKITLTNVATPSIYRLIVLKDSSVSSGSFSASIDPLVPNWRFLATTSSAQNIFSYGISSGTTSRFPVGSYSVEFQYADASTPNTIVRLTEASVYFDTTGTLCAPGTYSESGLAPCTNADPGSYVASSGRDTQFECRPGEFQDQPGQSSCIPARAGKFVADMAATTDVDCDYGKFSSSTRSRECQDAEPGYFVGALGQAEQTPCPLGKFQPSAGQRQCNSADANYFVATVGSTTQTACPSGYTSPVGSDASSDCVAPVVTQTTTAATTTAAVTKSLPTLAKGKKMRIRALATQIEMSLPARSKATAKVAKSSRKICRVTGTSIRALRKGSCVVTVKVKPRKGSATTKATTITIN